MSGNRYRSGPRPQVAGRLRFGSSGECSSLHRAVTGTLLLIAASLVLVSGVASHVGRWDLTVWPFNRAWFMFEGNDGLFYRFEVTGRRVDGSETPIDLGRWFKYPVGFETGRWNEIGRVRPSMEALARYVCRMSNEGLVGERRFAAVRLADWTWSQERGIRRRMEDASARRPNPDRAPVEVGCD